MVDTVTLGIYFITMSVLSTAFQLVQFLGLDIDNIEIFLTTAFSQVALPIPFQLGFLTFVVHNLTVQSNDDVTKRWEKSIGPTAM